MRWLKCFVRELRSIWDWGSFWTESEKKRQEFYRREIISAIEARDFERAAFLQTEARRMRSL